MALFDDVIDSDDEGGAIDSLPPRPVFFDPLDCDEAMLAGDATRVLAIARDAVRRIKHSSLGFEHAWASLAAESLRCASLVSLGRFEQVLTGTDAGRFLLGPHRPRKEGAEPPRLDRMQSLLSFFRSRVSLFVQRGIRLVPPTPRAEAECHGASGAALAQSLSGWREEEDPESGYFSNEEAILAELPDGAAPSPPASLAQAGALKRGASPAAMRLLCSRCVVAALLGLYQRLALTGPRMSQGERARLCPLPFAAAWLDLVAPRELEAAAGGEDVQREWWAADRAAREAAGGADGEGGGAGVASADKSRVVRHVGAGERVGGEGPKVTATGALAARAQADATESEGAFETDPASSGGSAADGGATGEGAKGDKGEAQGPDEDSAEKTGSTTQEVIARMKHPRGALRGACLASLAAGGHELYERSPAPHWLATACALAAALAGIDPGAAASESAESGDEVAAALQDATAAEGRAKVRAAAESALG